MVCKRFALVYTAAPPLPVKGTVKMAGEERSEDRTSRGKLLEGATVGRRGGRDGRWQKDRAEERMGWAEEEEIPLPHRQASPTGRAKC